MVTAVRTFAEFAADFPEDQVEQGAVIVRPGGLAVTKAIAEILRGVGMWVSAPLDAQDHGWELEACSASVRVRFQITDFDKTFILASRETTTVLETIRPQPTKQGAAVLIILNDGLNRHPKFSRIRWHAEPFDEMGQDTPVDIEAGDDAGSAKQSPPHALSPVDHGQSPRSDSADTKAMVSALRPCAEFVGDFPKDLIEDGYTLVRPNGLAATTAIGEVLAGLDLSVSKPVTTSDYGWQIVIRGKGLKVLFQVNDYDATFLLQSREATPIWQRVLLRQPVSYAALLTKLNDALRRHPKISQLSWHAQPYDGKGKETPVDETG